MSSIVSASSVTELCCEEVYHMGGCEHGLLSDSDSRHEYVHSSLVFYTRGKASRSSDVFYVRIFVQLQPGD